MNAHGPAAPHLHEVMAWAPAALSAWIDAHGANTSRHREAATWGRLAKVSEEAGEVIAAWIGATGQNPRKAITHTLTDVERELLDVAVTALTAVEHLRGNDGTSAAALADHLAGLCVRADLSSLPTSVRRAA